MINIITLIITITLTIIALEEVTQFGLINQKGTTGLVFLVCTSEALSSALINNQF